jgi:hypothetical protein
MHSLIRHARSIILACALLVGACATTPDPATVIRRTFNPGIDGFGNILIIGVAGDYESRAWFERDLAAAITDGQVTGSPYYTVVGRRPQLDRALILDAIRNREFDAVIFTRQKGQEQESLAPGRPVGPAFDLFGYDYTELNRDLGIEESRAHTFITEVYDTATQKKVWAIEALSVRKKTAEELIAEQVITIATQLRTDGLLGR